MGPAAAAGPDPGSGHERARRRPPLALRTAPAGISADASRAELLDALSVPLRTGFILAHRDVAAAAGQLGLGLRRGERRFALKAMLEQDPAATLHWLAEHAAAWSGRHGRRPAVPADPCAWWRERSAATAVALGNSAGGPSRPCCRCPHKQPLGASGLRLARLTLAWGHAAAVHA